MGWVRNSYRPVPAAASFTAGTGPSAVFPDRSRDREAGGPNQLWVADLTYIAILGGFVYMAAIMDAWSRRIVPELQPLRRDQVPNPGQIGRLKLSDPWGPLQSGVNLQSRSCLSMKLSKAAETQRMSHRGFQSLCHIRVRTVQLPPTSL